MESAECMDANAIFTGRTPLAPSVITAGRATTATCAIRLYAEMETALSMDANAIFTGRTPLAPSVNLAGRATIVTSAIRVRA
jgi:hypothetical protein